MHKVLIVEDDQDIRQLLMFTLVNAGYNVVLAADGTEAWEQALAAMPDVILLDVRMPRMDGFEVLRRLVKNPSTVAIPVIMVTARGERKDQQYAMKNGAFDYIVKPWSIGEVEHSVKLALEHTKRPAHRVPVPTGA